MRNTLAPTSRLKALWKRLVSGKAVKEDAATASQLVSDTDLVLANIPSEALASTAPTLTGINKLNSARRRTSKATAGICEVRRGDGEWRQATIAEALELRAADGKAEFRCAVCHVRVRLHKASKSGARAHVEHVKGDQVGAKRA